MKELLKGLCNEKTLKIIFKDGKNFSQGVKDCVPGGVVVGVLMGALTIFLGALGSMESN